MVFLFRAILDVIRKYEGFVQIVMILLICRRIYEVFGLGNLLMSACKMKTYSL